MLIIYHAELVLRHTLAYVRNAVLDIVVSMMTRNTVVFPYRTFGPYHVARLSHARKAFEEAGMTLVPLQLLRASRVYEWGNMTKLDGSVCLDLDNPKADSIRVRDVPVLLRALAKLRPTVVFVNGWSLRDAIAMHAWCFTHRVARVLVAESTWEDKPRNRVLESVKKLIIGGCGAAFVGGQPQTRYLKRLGFPEDRILQGCGVVDNRHFASARREVGRQGRWLLTVCRFVPEKNLLPAARAFLRFAAVRPANEAWHWTIVGYGSQAASLREFASTSQGRLSIEDFKAYEELPTVYANADLYFHPSIYEPWGLVVNEAMAAGLPVLVSRKCGCAEDLVHPEVGWVFDPHSEEAIMAGLHAAALGFDRWRKMGEAAAIRIGTWGLEKFSNKALQAARLAIGQQSG